MTRKSNRMYWFFHSEFLDKSVSNFIGINPVIIFRLGLKHLTGWEKMVFISDVDWIRLAIKIFGPAIPGMFACFITATWRKQNVGSASSFVQ